MAAPLTLHLVRHGEAEGAAGRCVGQCDLPLAPRGRADVARLAAEWHAPPARIWTSDLARARASAEILAASMGLTARVTVDARLREMSFGAWDGREWAALEREDGAALAAWMARWDEAATPDGESFGDVIARAGAWLADAVAQARAAGVDRVAVVAHAGSIRALLAHTLGLPRASTFRLRLDHARVSTLSVAGDVSRESCASAELCSLNADRVG